MPRSYSFRRLRSSLLFGLLSVICGLALVIGFSPSKARSTGVPTFSGEPAWGLDIRLINEPLSGESRGRDGTPRESEKNLSLAVSPVNRNFLVGGYETSRPSDNYVRYAASTDGGINWLGGSFNGLYMGDMQATNEPLVAFNAQGAAYYATLAFGATSSGFLVFTSTNGLSWGQPSPIVVTDNSGFHRLADLAVDQRTSGSGQYAGSLYFTSSYNQTVAPYTHGLFARYSRDEGVTWSSDIKVSDLGNEDAYKSSLKVASDGTVYVGYTQILSGSIESPPQLFLDRSTDGGRNWGTDRLITGAPITPIGEPDKKGHELVIFANTLCNELRINHYPVIGISPTNPDEVYVVWNDGRWEPLVPVCDEPKARHGDIAFSRTTDGGLTWSSPMRLNDDPEGNGIDQWQPNMEVAPDGTIGVTWYDRRYSTDHYWYDVAYTQSTDGGLTWSSNRRVTDQSSDATQLLDVKGVADLGYKTGTVFGSDYALTGWIDTRDAATQGHIYVDHGVFGAPTWTPTPSVTPSATPSATPSVTPTACTLSFTDVPAGSTFYTFVRCLACLGIVNGYADGTFRPNNNVTRGQLAKIVSNAAGFNDVVSGQAFQDVPPGSTFYTFTQRLSTRGVMSGYPCGGPGEPCVPPDSLPYFRINNNATRGEISKIVSQAAGFIDPPAGQIFEDVPPGSTFYTYTQRLASRSIMQGYPCGGSGEPCNPPANRPYFRPYNNATRGQTSKIVANTFFPDCNPPLRR
jgi:hypothetical protein